MLKISEHFSLPRSTVFIIVIFYFLVGIQYSVSGKGNFYYRTHLPTGSDYTIGIHLFSLYIAVEGKKNLSRSKVP